MSEPQASPPRKKGKCTGERLGNKVLLAQALLQGGDSISKTARDLKISPHSVRAIARRMQQNGIVSPEQVERIRRSIGGQFARLADRSLSAVDERKLRKTGAYELTRIAAMAAEKAGLVDAPSSSPITFIQQNYGLQPSHSASQSTIDITQTPEASSGSDVQAEGPHP